VDVDAHDWFEQEMRDLALGHEVERDWDDETGNPFMLCVECDEAGPDTADWQCTRLRFLDEVRSTRAALAAAEDENERLTMIDGDVGCEHPMLDWSQPGGYCGPCGNEMDRHSRAALAAALAAAEARADKAREGIAAARIALQTGVRWRVEEGGHSAVVLRDAIMAVDEILRAALSSPVQPEETER
jgi:hypothetical protein